MSRCLRVLLVFIASMAAMMAVTSPAYASNPYFFAQLNLTNYGHTVVAGGPMNWSPGDASAKIADVTITQGDIKGTSSRFTAVVNGQDVYWWLNASSSRQFHPGSAEAYALEIVHRTDGTTYTYRWETQVQLTGR